MVITGRASTVRTGFMRDMEGLCPSMSLQVIKGNAGSERFEFSDTSSAVEGYKKE